MRVMNCACAGLDVHQKTVVACTLVGSAGADPKIEKRTFGTSTSQLLTLADWLRQQGITHVAMESTGTYWKPVWAVLDGEFDLTLCNAAHIKQVPGRKTDQKDAEWIADLLRHGLLKKSFVPPQPQQDLRELTRYRAQVSADRSAVSNRIRKLLEGANIKLGSVASDVLGVSGRRMLEAIVKGEADPDRLADLALGQLKEKRAQLIEALSGRIRDHHRKLLRLELAQWKFLDALVAELEQAIEEALGPFLTAVELVKTVPGFSEVSAAAVIAEIGANMEQFGAPGRLSSWGGICPGNNASAGKQYSGKTRSGNIWLKRILCQVAWAASHTRHTYFAALFRRIGARRGKKRAILAVGHALLETIFAMLRKQQSYQELGADYFDRLHADGLKRYCLRKLEAMGHRVILEPAA
ncbi:MAG TPA: IS110 family transposase [Gemmataceae bacterium]|nr:IS110 family transposase [Gemmataceae bacterium]